MKHRQRIAVPIDLDWPLKRHYEVFSGIQDYARQKAPHWTLVPDLFPARRVATSRHESAGYDGIVGRVLPSDMRAARRARIPIVNVWMNSPVRDKVPSVVTDYVEVGRMAAEHMVSRGLRQFACAGYRQDAATRQFLTGVKMVAREHGIPITRHLSSFSNRNNETNWHRHLDGINRWIDGWTRPIGVLASYDNLTRVLATECQRRGHLIPDDVALIGSNDDAMVCEGSEPELSSIDVGCYRLGYRAAELLDDLLRGGSAPTEPILMPPADLVARQSTDVFAVADKTVGRAMRFIAERCGRPIRVDDVVDHIGCSRRSLERLFRAAGRRSINQEIVAMRIDLTKRLLVSTNDPIETVAIRSGYGSAQHMRHIFRHQVGESPVEYRRNHR
jgi:LacI family transcriptional regulator